LHFSQLLLINVQLIFTLDFHPQNSSTYCPLSAVIIRQGFGGVYNFIIYVPIFNTWPPLTAWQDSEELGVEMIYAFDNFTFIVSNLRWFRTILKVRTCKLDFYNFILFLQTCFRINVSLSLSGTSGSAYLRQNAALETELVKGGTDLISLWHKYNIRTQCWCRRYQATKPSIKGSSETILYQKY
jgi:hypothetical protein